MVIKKNNIDSSLIISLDFELFWGVRDSRGEEYFETLKNVHEVIPQLLILFEKYDISCTWASVGALFAESYEDFNIHKPSIVPSYEEQKFSPFNDLGYISSIDDKLLFAPQLISAIKNAPKQEFASHTFSHYYALEKGQTEKEFEADLEACNTIASNLKTKMTSLVFPRNQFNSAYLKICKKLGYTAYRGNPKHWAYQAESRENRSLLKRIFRLVDCYLPFSGSLRQEVKKDAASEMIDVPASIFFRPYSPKLSFFDGLKLWRLKWSMTRTAKKGGVFHLWWHPHNFGKYTDENLKQVEILLKHYELLNKKYNFQSNTMEQVANDFLAKNT